MSEIVNIDAQIKEIAAALPDGWVIRKNYLDNGLMRLLGFKHIANESRRDIYSKIVQREIQFGIKITDRVYILEILKDEAKGCVRATFSLNCRNIFAMDLMCDYHRARHIAIKAAAAWCKKSWRIKGV